jgi:hypothetical protein
MIFLFRWKHNDGSTVEFSEEGWKADDPDKNAWLIQTSELCRSSPVLAPAIRLWLQENCRLVEFIGTDDTVRSIKVPADSGRELGRLEVLARAANGGISPNFSDRSGLFRAGRDPRLG